MHMNMFKNNGKMHPWNKQIKMLSFLQNKKIKLRIFLNLPTYKGKAKNLKLKEYNQGPIFFYHLNHELRTPGEEIVFTARPKINSQSQISRYGQSIFCLPYRPKFSDFFDLWLHWVSVVRDLDDMVDQVLLKLKVS